MSLDEDYGPFQIGFGLFLLLIFFGTLLVAGVIILIKFAMWFWSLI